MFFFLGGMKMKVRFVVSYKGHIKFTIFCVIGATFWKKGKVFLYQAEVSVWNFLQLPAIFLAT